MTVLGGEIVHACDEFYDYDLLLPPVSPNWSLIKKFGIYGKNKLIVHNYVHHRHCLMNKKHSLWDIQFGCFCCDF